MALGTDGTVGDRQVTSTRRASPVRRKLFVPTQLGPRLGVLRLAVALSLGLLAFSFSWQVPGVKAAGAATSQASELVRLINGARAAAGKPALAVDLFLATQARDGAIPCPGGPAKTIAGRAQDFSAFGQMSHSLRLCDAATYTLSSTTFVSLLQSAWGYGSVGEILLVNGGYGNGQYLYTSGGWSTWTYATTGHAMTGWKTSSSHWNIIVGGYDRVGCGAWSPSGSAIYYACEFSSGGPSPNGLAAAPTGSPFSDPLPIPAPTVAPTPAPTSVPAPAATRAAPIAPPPVATPAAMPTAPPPAVTPAATAANSAPDASQAPAPTGTTAETTAYATATSSPTSVVQGLQANASQGAPGVPAAIEGGAGDLGVTSNATIPAGLTREAVLGFSAGAVMLIGVWVLIDRVRRRRCNRVLG